MLIIYWEIKKIDATLLGNCYILSDYVETENNIMAFQYGLSLTFSRS